MLGPVAREYANAFCKAGITIVLVTHEPDMAEYARRTLVFRDGHIASDEARVREAVP